MFLGIQRFVNGTADKLDRAYFGLFLILVPFAQYFVYVTMPSLKMFFTGGNLKVWEIHEIVKKTPSHMLRSWHDPAIGEKVFFVKEISEGKEPKFSELEYPIKFWLNDDQSQPDQDRYFKFDGDTVVLTPKGKELADLVSRKSGKAFSTNWPRLDENIFP